MSLYNERLDATAFITVKGNWEGDGHAVPINVETNEEGKTTRQIGKGPAKEMTSAQVERHKEITAKILKSMSGKRGGDYQKHIDHFVELHKPDASRFTTPAAFAEHVLGKADLSAEHKAFREDLHAAAVKIHEAHVKASPSSVKAPRKPRVKKAEAEPAPEPAPEPVKAQEPAPKATEPEPVKAPEAAPKSNIPLSESTQVLKARPEDIPYDIAFHAHAGSSYFPEDRAKQRQQDFANIVNNDYNDLIKKVRNENEKAILEKEFDAYHQQFKNRYIAALNADSRTLSTMITGPSNFNTSRNQKALDVANSRWSDVNDYREKALANIKKALRPELQPISSTDSEAISKLKSKLETLEKTQELMKSINKVVRGKGTDDEKIAKMISLGVKEENARNALQKDPFGNIGIASFALTNNNAEIKRVKTRIEELSKREAIAQDIGGSRSVEFDGGKIELDYANGYLRISHDSKPDDAVREKLKANGFNWTPSEGVWRRKLNNSAIWSAHVVTGAPLKDIDSKEKDKPGEPTETLQEPAAIAPEPAPAPSPEPAIESHAAPAPAPEPEPAPKISEPASSSGNIDIADLLDFNTHYQPALEHKPEPIAKKEPTKPTEETFHASIKEHIRKAGLNPDSVKLHNDIAKAIMGMRKKGDYSDVFEPEFYFAAPQGPSNKVFDPAHAEAWKRLDHIIRPSYKKENPNETNGIYYHFDKSGKPFASASNGSVISSIPAKITEQNNGKILDQHGSKLFDSASYYEKFPLENEDTNRASIDVNSLKTAALAAEEILKKSDGNWKDPTNVSMHNENDKLNFHVRTPEGIKTISAGSAIPGFESPVYGLHSRLLSMFESMDKSASATIKKHPEESLISLHGSDGSKHYTGYSSKPIAEQIDNTMQKQMENAKAYKPESEKAPELELADNGLYHVHSGDEAIARTIYNKSEKKPKWWLRHHESDSFLTIPTRQGNLAFNEHLDLKPGTYTLGTGSNDRFGVRKQFTIKPKPVKAPEPKPEPVKAPEPEPEPVKAPEPAYTVPDLHPIGHTKDRYGYIPHGSKVQISGNTFAHKDALRGAGARWNSAAKVWEIVKDKKNEKALSYLSGLRFTRLDSRMDEGDDQITVGPLAIDIECQPGEERFPGAFPLPCYYGSIDGTTSPDGEPVDAYVSIHAADQDDVPCVIVAQTDGDEYDEPKVFLGFSPAMTEAIHRAVAPGRFGGCVSVPLDSLLDRLEASISPEEDEDGEMPAGIAKPRLWSFLRNAMLEEEGGDLPQGAATLLHMRYRGAGGTYTGESQTGMTRGALKAWGGD